MTDYKDIFKGNRNYDSEWYKRAINLRTQIVNRCTDPNHHLYPAYGGRGVTVDNRWVESFDYFLEDIVKIEGWDYNEWVSGNLQLDKDLKGDKRYSVTTCTWLTPKENNSLGNGEGFRAVNPNGEVEVFKSATAFAKEKGFSYDKVNKRARGTINNNLLLDGWFIPLQKKTPKVNRFLVQLPVYVKDVLSGAELEFSTIKEASDFLGVGVKIVRNVINPNSKTVLTAGHFTIKDSANPYKKGEYIQYRTHKDVVELTFNTLKDMCDELDLNITCVSECLNGKQQTHKGLTFETVVTKF